MTDAEIDALTLGDLKRIAERASAAAKTFAEVRALFGPPAGPLASVLPQPPFPAEAPQTLPVDTLSLGRPPNSPDVERYLETVRGQREELVAQIRPPPKPPNPEDFPPDIAGAMRQS